MSKKKHHVHNVGNVTRHEFWGWGTTLAEELREAADFIENSEASVVDLIAIEYDGTWTVYVYEQGEDYESRRSVPYAQLVQQP